MPTLSTLKVNPAGRWLSVVNDKVRSRMWRECCAHSTTPPLWQSAMHKAPTNRPKQKKRAAIAPRYILKKPARHFKTPIAKPPQVCPMRGMYVTDRTPHWHCFALKKPLTKFFTKQVSVRNGSMCRCKD